MKQTIAIDIDDVIADSTDALRILVNDRTGSQLTTDDYLQDGEYWGYYERVWSEHGLADQVSFADFEEEMENDQSHVPLLPGADFAIKELLRHYKIIFITARNNEWKQATLEWMRRHFGQSEIEVHFTGHRHSVDYKSKGELCRDTGAFLMIDDNPGHCQSVMEFGVQAILFGTYGWHTEIPEGVIKCKDWPAVIDYVEKLRSHI